MRIKRESNFSWKPTKAAGPNFIYSFVCTWGVRIKATARLVLSIIYIKISIRMSLFRGLCYGYTQWTRSRGCVNMFNIISISFIKSLSIFMRPNRCTGWYTFYHIKYSKENLFMWSPKQKTLILPHIRAMNFRSQFVEISDHMSKLKFYHIFSDQSQSITHNARICGKIKVFCMGDHMNKFSFEYFMW